MRTLTSLFPFLLRTTLAWGATFALAPLASAIPSIENGLWLSVPHPLGTLEVRLLRDTDSPHRLWWSPFEMVVEKNPSTGRPQLTWEAYETPPRIALVAGLQSVPPGIVREVRHAASAESGIPENLLELSPFTLINVELVVRTEMATGYIYGTWRPETTLIVRNVPEVLELDEETNDHLLNALRYDAAGPQIALGFKGAVLARSNPRELSRSYRTSCVERAFLRGRTLDLMRAKTWDERGLRNVASHVEGECVDRHLERGGEVSVHERIESWLSMFSSAGIVADGGNRKWVLGETQAWQTFLADPVRDYSITFPEEVGPYPIEFGMRLHRIQPTERRE